MSSNLMNILPKAVKRKAVVEDKNTIKENCWTVNNTSQDGGRDVPETRLKYLYLHKYRA